MSFSCAGKAFCLPEGREARRVTPVRGGLPGLTAKRATMGKAKVEHEAARLHMKTARRKFPAGCFHVKAGTSGVFSFRVLMIFPGSRPGAAGSFIVLPLVAASAGAAFGPPQRTGKGGHGDEHQPCVFHGSSSRGIGFGRGYRVRGQDWLRNSAGK